MTNEHKDPSPVKAGWTPGPWRMDGHKVRDGKVVSVTISHGLNTYGDGPEGYICVTCEGLDGKSEANARLIAAAPALAEALDYVWENTFCGADAEWHFKPGYDPQRVIDALNLARPAPIEKD